MKSCRLPRWLYGLLFLVLFARCGMLYAQETSGNITGQVLDPSGLGVPGARVTVTNQATNVATATTSTETGNYNVIVYPGVYRVAAEADGFKRSVRNDVTVTASTTVRVDAVLELGSLAESVEVSGTLLSVQSENAKVSTSVENKFVDELPLVVGGRLRNPYDLVQIAAQVTTASDTEMSLGGGQSRSWNATLDGLGITTNRPAETFEVAYAAPSLEAITEFAVDTNGFKAEYGQAAGGVITFSSRSGTTRPAQPRGQQLSRSAALRRHGGRPGRPAHPGGRLVQGLRPTPGHRLLAQHQDHRTQRLRPVLQ